ncbi:MAG: (Fe-S)-binding protein [Saprospiraceae bacterium]
MHIGLFIPCYIDQFYPAVGVSTLSLLERLGCKVTFPLEQTCCGQPMANSGCEQDALPVYRHFAKTFAAFDYVVTPSGSCAYHVRKHFDIAEQTPAVAKVRQTTLELSEFLLDVLDIRDFSGNYFPYRVGIHQSCHGLRGLRLGQASELQGKQRNNIRELLQTVGGIDLVPLNRQDECCGFGGTFSVTEASVSVKMGKDRIRDHVANGAEVMTAGDMSCLMHLEGIIRRQRLPIRVMHYVQILNP